MRDVTAVLLFLGVVGSGVSPAESSPNSFLHIRTDFLGADSTLYYTLTTAWATVPGNTNAWTDSTWLICWDLKGRAVSKDLVRARTEHRKTDDSGRWWREGLEEFQWKENLQEFLATRRIRYAFPESYFLKNIQLSGEGIVLASADTVVVVIPSAALRPLLSEFGERYDRRPRRVLNVYQGPTAYFVHVQEDCMDTDIDCRSVVIPVSNEVMMMAVEELGRGGKLRR